MNRHHLPSPTILAFTCATLLLLAVAPKVQAQPPATPEQPPQQAAAEGTPGEPQKVDVVPVAEDTEIEHRLTRILEATEWFRDPRVSVDQGVVFLEGRTNQTEYKDWATKLAGKTQDVVAVVNRMEVVERPLWDLSPALHELQGMGKQLVQGLPLFAMGLLMLVVAWVAAKAVTFVARRILKRRVQNELLLGVGTKAMAIPVFLVGLYLALRVSGLSNLAMTVLGGTGLIGLAVGIAFRDIAENFLASLLISVQRPFRSGDFIEVAGNRGFVQSVTTRGTLLMTLEGNHVQIPNATIYKETITNFTANPNVRLDFVVGVGYNSSIAKARRSPMRYCVNTPQSWINPNR